MFSFVTKIWDFFSKTRDDKDFGFTNSSDIYRPQDQLTAEFKNKKFFRRSGTVSFITCDYGLIDQRVYFMTEDVRYGARLAVGDSVIYVSYKASEDEDEKVISVERYIDLNAWSSVTQSNNRSSSAQVGTVETAVLSEANRSFGRTTENVLNREITFNKGEWINIFPSSDQISSDDEDCEFLPIEARLKWRALSLKPSDDPSSKSDNGQKKFVLKKKHGIVILGKVQFGPMAIDTTEELILEIKNTRRTNQHLTHTGFRSSTGSSQLTLKEPEFTDSVVLKCGRSVKYTFTCNAKFLGISTELFVFYFKGFEIEHAFTINVTLSKEIRALMPEGRTEEIHPKKNCYLYNNFDCSDAFYGTKPNAKPRFGGRNKPQSNMYNLPETLFKIVLGDPGLCKSKKHSHIVETVLKHYPCLSKNLNFENYKERFHTLLYLEEIEDRIMYRRYDLHNVTLRKRDRFLSLTVPRTVEDKVLLATGTHVILTQPWSEANPMKQVGYIHDYRDHELLISFHESFERTYDESECDISFQPSRTTYIRSHMAVDKAVAGLGKPWLFPMHLKESPPILTFEDSGDEDSDILSVSDYHCDIDNQGFAVPASRRRMNASNFIEWFNKDLNYLQKAAIRNILEGRGRKLPYIIQGPPGTGKTVTIIELILQIYHLISDSRIVVATPSNSAADLICQKLIRSGFFIPGQIVRLLSYGRLIAGNFPVDIAPFCTSAHEDTQVSTKTHQKTRVSNMSELLGNERIVIGTCSTLAVLHDLDTKRSQFSHIIIDEAAQATEPESLIPINLLDGKRGQVILSGDTEQLGPISMNFISVRFGFSKSFMERINNTRPYIRNKSKFPMTEGFDPRCVTRLRMNYRSVPDILRLPNTLFYNSELIPTLSQAEGKEAEIIRKFNMAIESQTLTTPMLFHGLRSLNYQEENNFSWYNPHELWQTVCYLKKLYSISLKPEDIGIITPYQKQVEKLRLMLNSLSVPCPKIGSVEEFQGQERSVIILSTVRSSIHTVGSKEKLIGFLSSPRRVNVAITRARALLIIIGNPFTLCVDRYWYEVIKYCVKHKFYIGCPIDGLKLQL